MWLCARGGMEAKEGETALGREEKRKIDGGKVDVVGKTLEGGR